MKFHTRLGAKLRLFNKEISRQFDGLTITVRPFWGKPVEGKYYTHVVSLVRVSDGSVDQQILVKSKREIGAACAHIMRWLDKCSFTNTNKAASSSRDRTTRKADAENRATSSKST